MRFLKRLVVCVICGLTGFALAFWQIRHEAFFWAFVTFIGSLGFLMPKPAISMKERFRMIGLWDLMAPAVLVLFATAHKPDELYINAMRLVFLAIFSIGIATAGRLFLHRK